MTLEAPGRASRRSRDCAVCGGSRKILVHRLELGGASTELHDGYDVVLCAECRFAFADRLPTQSHFDAYYANGHGGTGEPEGADAHSAENVKRILPPSADLLDIGCGDAGLLAILRRDGFARLKGLEPSRTMAAAARARHGLEIAEGTLASHGDLGRFDVLVLRHVLEHIEDLGAALDALHALSKPATRIYIEVPDATQFDRTDTTRWSFAKDFFAQLCPEHVNFFTPTSLRNLMARRGFRPIYVESQMSTIGIVASAWEKVAFVPDDPIEAQPAAYVAQSQAALDQVARVVDDVVPTDAPILVWGAGLHTRRLLASSRLGRANIVAFVDGNRALVGQRLAGKPIVLPTEVPGLPAVPILVSTRRSQDEVEREIARRGFSNRVLLLYPRGA